MIIKDGISDNKVKFGKNIYTVHVQPIIFCYMDIPMHPSLKKQNNYGDICL